MDARDTERLDNLLLAELAAALAGADHPQAALIIANAQDTFNAAHPEAELAQLVYDSLVADEVMAAMRGPAEVRLVVFETEALSIAIEIRADDIIGQVEPPGTVQVSVQSVDGGVAEATTDEWGRFTLPSVGAGPLRFRLRRPGSSVVTEWTHPPDFG